MTVKVGDWDKDHWPHPNVTAIPLLPVAKAEYFMASTTLASLTNGQELPLLTNRILGSPGTLQVNAPDTDSGSVRSFTITVEGRDQFGDQLDATKRFSYTTNQGSHMGMMTWTEIHRVTIDDIVDTGAGNGTINLSNHGDQIPIGLPFKFSSESFGDEIIAVTRYDGVVHAKTDMTLSAKYSSIRNTASGGWNADLNWVFVNLQKLSGF